MNSLIFPSLDDIYCTSLPLFLSPTSKSCVTRYNLEHFSSRILTLTLNFVSAHESQFLCKDSISWDHVTNASRPVGRQADRSAGRFVGWPVSRRMGKKCIYALWILITSFPEGSIPHLDSGFLKVWKNPKKVGVCYCDTVYRIIDE